MTTPRLPDPAVLDRLDAQLRDVAHAVERVRHDMTALRPVAPLVPAGPPAPPPAQAQAPPAGLPSGPFRATPRPPFPPPGRPPGPAAHPASPVPPVPPRRTAALAREGLGARLLAAAGAAVTLIGVVMLLVLAARHGWFGPGVRVVVGAVLGLGLAATGLRVRVRHAGRTTGAVALVATGVAALYLDLAAASALYGFLPGPATLVLGMGVLAGGLVVADRWSTPGLAIGAVVGIVALVPVVARTAPEAVLPLLAVVQLPVAFQAWRRGWSAPVLVATGGAVLVALVQGAAFAGRSDAALVPYTVGAVALLVVAVALAAANAQTLPLRVRVAVAVVPLLPVLTASGLHGRWPGVAVAGLVAGLLVALAEGLRRTRAETVLPTVLGAMGAVAGFQATTLALAGSSLAMLLLGQATVLAVVARVTGHRGPLVAAVTYGFTGLGIALDSTLPIAAVTAFPRAPWVAAGPVRDVPALVAAVAAAVLLTAAAAMVLHAALRLLTFPDRATRWTVCGALGTVTLYGATATVIAVALLVSPSRTAFLAGHVVVTVSWTVLALLLLARGLRDSTPRVLGAVLVVAAIAKLLLFDLVALDGIARVAAFVGAGLVLLVAGTRYASLVAGEAGADGRAQSSSPSQ